MSVVIAHAIGRERGVSLLASGTGDVTASGGATVTGENAVNHELLVPLTSVLPANDQLSANGGDTLPSPPPPPPLPAQFCDEERHEDTTGSRTNANVEHDRLTKKGEFEALERRKQLVEFEAEHSFRNDRPPADQMLTDHRTTDVVAAAWGLKLEDASVSERRPHEPAPACGRALSAPGGANNKTTTGSSASGNTRALTKFNAFTNMFS